MPTQHHDILIQAPRAHVWRTMLTPDTYMQWTAPFCEGSRYEGSWAQGQRIRFLSPSGEGMVAEIAENREGEFISIRQLGFVLTDGSEDTTSEAVRAWAPAYENYTFSDEAGGTRVQVAVDVPGDYEAWMGETWPKALQALKSISENTQRNT